MKIKLLLTVTMDNKECPFQDQVGGGIHLVNGDTTALPKTNSRMGLEK